MGRPELCELGAVVERGGAGEAGQAGEGERGEQHCDHSRTDTALAWQSRDKEGSGVYLKITVESQHCTYICTEQQKYMS